MTRSKKIFVVFAALFALFLVFIVYDISTRTTFPGSRPRESTSAPEIESSDTLRSDTTP